MLLGNNPEKIVRLNYMNVSFSNELSLERSLELNTTFRPASKRLDDVVFSFKLSSKVS